MILTDRTNTFTTDNEDIEEQTILNGSSILRVGGSPALQADSNRYKLLIKVRTLNSETNNDDAVKLRSIINNFGAKKFYTPRRLLEGQTSIGEIEVIVKSYRPNIRAWAGSYVLYYDIEMEQVI